MNQLLFGKFLKFICCFSLFQLFKREELIIAPKCDHKLNSIWIVGAIKVLFSVSGTSMSEGANQIKGSLTRQGVIVGCLL